MRLSSLFHHMMQYIFLLFKFFGEIKFQTFFVILPKHSQKYFVIKKTRYWRFVFINLKLFFLSHCTSREIFLSRYSLKIDSSRKMPKDPRNEMEVVYDGLAPIIGEPGSDDEVASTYDCGVQNDVGRESMRKKREANDGFHRRQRRKIQKLQHPANIPSSSRPIAAVSGDARELIAERREERGEEETEEEKEERKWQQEQQRQMTEALKRQKALENGDFSGFRIVEEGPANTPSLAAPRNVEQRKSAVRARRMIASASQGSNIKSLMRFPIGAPNAQKELRLQRALPSTSTSSTTKEIRRTLFQDFVDAATTPTVETATRSQETAMEVVISRHGRQAEVQPQPEEEEEEGKTLRQVIREEVTSALRASIGSRGWSKEGGRSGWTPSPLPERSSPAPRRHRSPLPPPRRPASRPDRREDRSRHSVDRRFQSQPSRRLPRRSPSPASHRARDASRKYRGERDYNRRRDATPTDRSRPRRPSPAPSSRSSKSTSQPARSWKKERGSRH